MAQVTVVVTEKNFAAATGKFHSNWNCVGLRKRNSPLVEVALGAAVTKGLTGCTFC
jgi:hypothetical protein